MYRYTLRKKNPILFFILLFLFSLSLLSFKTYYFSFFILTLWGIFEYFYRLPIFYPKKYLNVLDKKLGLIPEKKEENIIILSPNYGKIHKIEKGEHFTRIISCLSIFDIHYQFAPIDSNIDNYYYKKGTYYIAYILEKSEHNERQHTIFKHNNGLSIEVIQIAGVLTRRIENFYKKHQTYIQGSPYGLIHFGSRVDTILPNTFQEKSIRLRVNTGDKVYGPTTILCEYL